MGQFAASFAPALILLAAGIVLVLVWLAARRRAASQIIGRANDDAERLLRDAEARQKELLLAAKEEAHALRQKAERDERAARERSAAGEQALAARERETDAKERAAAERASAAAQKDQELGRREASLREREATAAARAERYEQLARERERELQRVSGMTAEEAKEALIRQIESEARRDAANLVKRLEHEAREAAAEKARQIITQAIQRSAPEHAVEATVSVVDLPSDDLKGRIIGREGRNIRALENATGVELIVDDTPEAIILSSFDPYRRTIAKQSIEQLVADGRIHPARIEEVVEKVTAEIDEASLKEGEAAGFELGLHDMHPEIYRLMGRLRFRTSYGQNVLAHSKEVAYLAGVMAREVGLDAHVCIRAAFVHDIGKAMDRDLEGTHLQLGISFLRQHGESDAVVDAMAAHHMDIDWPSLESMIVQAADAVSAARPGARRDILESYVKRLEQLEEIADSFKGVNKAFALQAGREIRIMVESEQVSDEDAVWLSKDIAKRIENELEYPGQIKVTVIRETRAIDYAR